MIRYLAVGGFNTVFGYGLFALLNWALKDIGAYAYMLASLLANLIAISVAFLGYKWFVFRTRGNYLAEWLRCVGVYSTTILITLIGLPILVPILRRHLAIMAVVTVIGSFFGHKHVSFRQRRAEP